MTYCNKEYKKVLGMSIRQFAKKQNIPYETVIHHCKTGYCSLVKRPQNGQNHRLYKCYRDIITRCYKPSHKQYHRYGGRGIKMCPRWFYSFDTFVEDMYPSYIEGMSIDRIDNSLGYYKENCRWADPITQIINRDVVTDTPGLRKSVSGNLWVIQIMDKGKTYTYPSSKTFKQALRVWEEACRKHKRPYYEDWKKKQNEL